MTPDPADACPGTRRKSLRQRVGWLTRTPFHPQWHMASRRVDPALSDCQGIVLDIGAADGWLRSFLSPSARYVAFDYPVTAMGLYRTRPDVFGDAATLPFADGSFDAVACYEVLEHVRKPDAVMAEISRVLVPGGVAELSMPFLYPVHDAPHDYQRWTRHGWQRSAESACLVVEKLQPVNHPLASAAVLGCLALAAPLQEASKPAKFFLLPLAALAIPVINLLAWAGMRVWPQWPAMTTGHRVLLRKRS